jgi:hypothetical protein
MNRIGALTRVVALSALAVTAPLAAQTGSNVKYNLAAGLSLANGGFGDRNDAGYALVVGIGMAQRGSPISFRAEGLYNEFKRKNSNAKAKAGGASANAIYDLSLGPDFMFTPYGIGGLALINTREEALGNVSRTNVGWNLGGGIRFPLTGFDVYVEARYYSISDVNVAFTPIVFGLVF